MTRIELPTRKKPFAFFSECSEHTEDDCPEDCLGRLYRYLLGWPTGVADDRVCLFLLSNPSKASATVTDRTLIRCIQYGAAWGFGWSWLANARGWRATKPDDVPPDPTGIGAENDDWVQRACQHAEIVVCGWGKHGAKRGPRLLSILREFGRRPHALKLNKDGSPQHPLFLAASLRPFPMEAR